MPYRPLGDVLIVKLDPDTFKSIKEPDKVIIPEAYLGGYKKKAQTGIVFRKGNTCNSVYKIGDRVRFRFSNNRPGYLSNGSDYRFVLDHELDWVEDA